MTEEDGFVIDTAPPAALPPAPAEPAPRRRRHRRGVAKGRGRGGGGRAASEREAPKPPEARASASSFYMVRAALGGAVPRNTSGPSVLIFARATVRAARRASIDTNPRRTR